MTFWLQRLAMVILLLLATADRTLRKGVKAFKKESNLNKES